MGVDIREEVRKLAELLPPGAAWDNDMYEIDLPGFEFHPLRGRPKRFAVAVNGPWRITFEWIDGEPWNVDLVQYH